MVGMDGPNDAHKIRDRIEVFPLPDAPIRRTYVKILTRHIVKLRSKVYFLLHVEFGSGCYSRSVEGLKCVIRRHKVRLTPLTELVLIVISVIGSVLGD